MEQIQNALENARSAWPGPVLLLAGPGTGKTHQLALRVKFLLEERDADPSEIAVITFTNEAARNMREKLTHGDISIAPELHPEMICTMHKLGNDIIASAPQAVGLKTEHSVLPHKSPRVVLIEDGAQLAGYDRTEWRIVDECRRKGDCAEDQNLKKCRICEQYTKILRKCSVVDHDDQILLACKVLRSNAEAREKWQHKTRYLLVDEYQDINEAQYQMIRLLCDGQEDGLFVVGDDDQSIYSFRGGNPRYVRSFEKSFGGDAKLGCLSMNWRCPEPILNAARAVLKAYYKKSLPKPQPRFTKDVLEVEAKVVLHDLPSDSWEANAVAQVAKDNVKTHSVIVLTPSRNYLPRLKKAFARKQVDYRYKFTPADDGLVRLAVLADWAEGDRSNWKTRYLVHLIINNCDDLLEEADVPGRGITRKRAEADRAVAELWSKVHAKRSLQAIITSLASRKTDNGLFWHLKQRLEAVSSLLADSGGSRESLAPFLQAAGSMVAPGRSPKGLVSEVREWSDELMEGASLSGQRPVRVFNVPSSKGLEAHVVCIIGLNERIFPDAEAESDLEEQARLMYVAMTRARKELHLFGAKSRDGSVTLKQGCFNLGPSPFVDAIPRHIMQVERKWAGKPKRRAR
jgi:DNA helicase-2/ATP-dependent DNA helicase PcrA